VAAWRYQIPYHFSGKLIRGKVWSNKFAHGLDSSVLRPNVKMCRGARLSETVVQAQEVCIPPLSADHPVGDNHLRGIPVGEVCPLEFAPTSLLHGF